MEFNLSDVQKFIHLEQTAIWQQLHRRKDYSANEDKIVGMHVFMFFQFRIIRLFDFPTPVFKS
jgi:hypothetical protein